MLTHSAKIFNSITTTRPPLNHYILYYNLVFPGNGMFAKNYTLMPDVCGTLSLAFDGDNILAELWGVSVTPTLLGAEPNKYRVMLLVQLSSYGLYQITNYCQTEFADKRMMLKDVDYELFQSLRHAFTTAKNAADLFSRCDRILYSRVESRIVSDAILSTVNVILKHQGQILVGEVAKQVCYSERQLNRLFLRQIGVNVKTFVRLTRFNNVLQHIQQSTCFASLSQRAGYFDQSHFDKDFKAISGITPQNYLKNMSDFYYDTSNLSAMISPRKER